MRLRGATTSPRGMTVIEILVGMTIFAIGCLTLTQVMFGAMNSREAERFTVVATSLAHERMAEIVGSDSYSSISEIEWPEEDFGEVHGGAPEFAGYRRTVSVADSLGQWGQSVLKDVTVVVQWRERGKLRNVSLRSSVSRMSYAGL